jgi:DNA/RNA-binding domain of Phe-tRNA-synthetase-like protein
MIEIRIQEDIFREYPTFRRGIVVAGNVHNKGRSGTLEAKLEKAVADAAKHPIDIKSNPRTAVWNEAHRQFKSNPNKFPPAHCALLKRVQKPGTHIPFINKIVAIMNYNSIKDVTPVGGDDLMHAGRRLRPAVKILPLWDVLISRKIPIQARSYMWSQSQTRSCVAAGTGVMVIKPVSPKKHKRSL